MTQRLALVVGLSFGAGAAFLVALALALGAS